MPSSDDRSDSTSVGGDPIQAALVSFLQESVGDALRTVLQYDDGSATLLYARPDAVADDSASEMRAFVEDLREAETREQRRTELHNVGSHHATVRLYDESVLVHFPRENGPGTLVTVDPTVASDLNEFVAACLRQLEESREPTPDGAGGK